MDMKELKRNHITTAMATCHSLTIINKELSGDPLDLIMFEATDWVIIINNSGYFSIKNNQNISWSLVA